MLLLAILVLPLITGLLCLIIPSRPWREGLNLAVFSVLAVLAVALAREILQHGTVSGLNGYLYADALSSLVALLISFVALVTGIYAVGYFREDERVAKVTL